MEYTENEGELQINDPSWQFQRMGLYNLTQMCRQHPSSKWKGLIIEHFDNLVKTASFETAFFEKAHDYSYARSYLGIRIGWKGGGKMANDFLLRLTRSYPPKDIF